jgi:hypothetical protein
MIPVALDRRIANRGFSPGWRGSFCEGFAWGAQSMGAEGPRPFSAIIAAKRDGFISYREAISKLAESTGDPLGDVAMVLKQREMHTRNGAYLLGPEHEVQEIQSPDALGALLDQTIRTGGIVAAQCDSGADVADPDRIGWMRSRFTAELTTSELPCPTTLETPSVASAVAAAPSTAEKSPAGWMMDMRAMASFTPWEAASIIVGVDPYEPDWGDGTTYDRDPGARSEIQRYRRLLVTAIDAKELPANRSRIDPDTPEIPHAHIRAWCRKYGYDWPIPELHPSPTTDAELSERLRAVEAERDGPKLQLAGLSDVASDHDRLREQVAILTGTVSELTGLLGAADARIQELSGDLAQGKSKTLMLQVIGAMAMTGHGIDIHASRMNGLGELQADIHAKGVPIGEDTLRTYLKDAAATIPKPASK